MFPPFVLRSCPKHHRILMEKKDDVMVFTKFSR
jgi:hypothetical protein